MVSHPWFLPIVIVAIPAVFVFFWPWWNATIVLPLFIAVLIGWSGQMAEQLAYQETYDAELERREAAGEEITAEEWGQDGVGENVAILFMGWLPPLFIGGIALGARALVWRRHWIRRRGTDRWVSP